MKIFVSYSRRDARDFAEQISETLEDEHDVFTDIDDIEAGDIWTNVIEDNISRCDVFLVILTFASLRSSEVEKEVLQAQKKSKKIIPCVDRGIDINQLKWDLGKFQGIEFSSKYELAREVYRKIQHHQQNPLKEEPSVQPVKEQPSVQPVKDRIFRTTAERTTFSTTGEGTTFSTTGEGRPFSTTGEGRPFSTTGEGRPFSTTGEGKTIKTNQVDFTECCNCFNNFGPSFNI